MKTSELTAETVIQSIGTSKATSLGQLHRAMGGKGSVPGAVAKKWKVLVPDIAERLAANKDKAEGEAGGEPKAEKAAKTPPKAKAAKTSEAKPVKRLVKRAEANPFRDGSGYGLLYDILAAAGADGMTVEAWKQRYMDITGKDEAHTRFDSCVVLSAKESPTSLRHRSCREGFWVERTNDHVALRIG